MVPSLPSHPTPRRIDGSCVWAAALGLILVGLAASPFVSSCATILITGFQDPIQPVDPRQWHAVAEATLETTLPSGIVVENCAIGAGRDGGPIIRLSGPPDAVAELIRRMPIDRTAPGEAVRYGNDLPWFTIPTDQVEAKLTTQQTGTGFVIAYVSKPVGGRVTMLAEGWAWKKWVPWER